MTQDARRGGGDDDGVSVGSLVAVHGQGPLRGELDAVVSSLRGGGRSVLLLGPGGSGRTTLLDAVARSAGQAGVRVAWWAGRDAERTDVVASISELLAGELARLTPLHQSALRHVTTADGPAPSRLVLSTAVLGLARAAARTCPLLLLVDDVDRLDPADLDVVAFVARRLAGSSVGLVAAARPGASAVAERAMDDCRVVPPLSAAAAAALVRDRFPVLPDEVVQDVVGPAGGNPGTLVARGHDALAGLARADRLGRPDASTSITDRVRDLPGSAREILLLAAFDDHPTVGSLGTALGQDPGAGLAAAAAAGLVDVDPATGAVHLLGRDRSGPGPRPATSAPERGAVDEAGDGPGDDRVAAQLDVAATETLARGDVTAAAAILGRAAELSPRPRDRARRFAAAACGLLDVTGDFEVARAWFDRSRATGCADDDSLEAATVGATLGIVDGAAVDELYPRVERALRRHGDDAADWVLAEGVRVLLLLAWSDARPELWGPVRELVARHRARLPAWAPLAAGHGHVLERDYPALEAVTLRLAESLQHETNPTWIVRTGFTTRHHSQGVQWRAALDRIWAGGWRRHGLAPVLYAAHLLATDDFAAGDWTAAQQVIDSALELCEDHDHRHFVRIWLEYLDALLAAGRGDATTVARRTRDIHSWAEPRGYTALRWRAQHARVLLALSQGDHHGAHRELHRLAEPTGYGQGLLSDERAALDHAEAVLVAGTAAERAALRGIADVAAVPGERRELVYLGVRAILDPDGAGVAWFRRALALPTADRWPFDLARLRLVHGERLRSAGDEAAARTQLRTAADTFRALGASPWLERARQGLRSLGEEHRVGLGRPAPALSAIELRVAELAASGMSNRAIAGAVHASVSTVSGHLSRTYAKLGITSRAALRDALLSA
jgi:DNA-binding CsgD family transcriptional regulator